MTESRTEPAGPLARAGAVALLVLGIGLGAFGGVLLGVLAGFWIPLRIDVVRIPVSILIAGAGNYLLVRWTAYVGGRWAASLAPSITWFATVLVLGARQPSGDLIIVGNDWVGVATLFVGAASLMLGMYLAYRRDQRAAVVPPPQPTDAGSRADDVPPPRRRPSPRGASGRPRGAKVGPAETASEGAAKPAAEPGADRTDPDQSGSRQSDSARSGPGQSDAGQSDAGQEGASASRPGESASRTVRRRIRSTPPR